MNWLTSLQTKPVSVANARKLDGRFFSKMMACPFSWLISTMFVSRERIVPLRCFFSPEADRREDWLPSMTRLVDIVTGLVATLPVRVGFNAGVCAQSPITDKARMFSTNFLMLFVLEL